MECFLGATDHEMLDSLLEEFGSSALPPGIAQGALPPATGDSFADSAKGNLKGVHRELFQKLVKSRKELDRYITEHKVELPGEIFHELSSRLDVLTETFRVLAFRGCLFTDFLTRHPQKSLIKEAELLEKKSEEATSSKAADDFLKAAEGKRNYAEKLSVVTTKVEDIEAKLHHIISTVERVHSYACSFSHQRK